MPNVSPVVSMVSQAVAAGLVAVTVGSVATDSGAGAAVESVRRRRTSVAVAACECAHTSSPSLRCHRVPSCQRAPPISSPVSMTGRSRSTPICSGAGAWRGSVASGRAATGSMSRPYSDQWPSWSEMTWREESEVNSGWSSEIPGSVGLGSPGSDLRGRSMPSPLSTATAGIAGVRTSTSHRVVPSQGMFGCSQPMNARVLPSGESLGHAMK